MQKILIAVCGEDPVFGERLAEYCCERNRGNLEISIYSDPVVFGEEVEQKKFHAALMSGEFWEKELVECGITRFIYLSEGTVPEQWRSYPAICKYQSADNILREIFGLIEENSREIRIHSGKQELIGVYSPHQHEMQMLFSLTLAELLGENARVLYLNLMDCAGFSGIYEEEYEQDFGDLIYMAKTAGGAFGTRLRSMIHSRGNIDFVPPATNPENLHEAEKEDYEKLLDMLCEQTDYEVIILDFGAMIAGFYDLLYRCSTVYCPVKEGFLYRCRIEQFQNCLALASRHDLIQNIQYLTFSMELANIQDEEHLRQQLLWGELGDYIRSRILGSMQTMA